MHLYQIWYSVIRTLACHVYKLELYSINRILSYLCTTISRTEAVGWLAHRGTSSALVLLRTEPVSSDSDTRGNVAGCPRAGKRSRTSFDSTSLPKPSFEQSVYFVKYDIYHLFTYYFRFYHLPPTELAIFQYLDTNDGTGNTQARVLFGNVFTSNLK